MCIRDRVYTLVETIAPNGFAKAESIRFKLVQRQDENGVLLPENDVYVCTYKAVSYTHLDVYKRQTFESTIYDPWEVIDREGKKWRFVYDSSIKATKRIHGRQVEVDIGQMCIRDRY